MKNNPDYDKISVAYKPDIQNFIKRLRSFVQYHKEFTNKSFEYFYCNEYGEKGQRNHWHLLLFIPKEMFVQWKNAIVENWPFSSRYVTYRGIEVAKNAANYVASYVNCITSLPSFFRAKAFYPTHNHSQHFGFGNDNFLLYSLLESANKYNCEYPAEFIVNGVSEIRYLPFPSYVTNRYFPKFKGFSKLSDYALYDVLANPDRLQNYGRKLGFYDYLESTEFKLNPDYNRDRWCYYKGSLIPFTLKRTIQFLNNKKLYFEYLISLLSYDEQNKLLPTSPLDENVFACTFIWFYKQRSNSRWKRFYESQQGLISITESYDNWEKVDRALWPIVPYETNPNRYNCNIVENNRLLEKFVRHKHTRIINDTIDILYG